VDSGLASGTTYYYRVAAANASGASAYSSTASAAIQGSSVLPPTNLTATVASASQVNLSWTDNSGGVYSYQIERSTDGSNYTLIATTGTGATSYADKSLAAATYYYQVVATTNGSDNKGSTAVASAVLAPAAPGSLTATAFFSHQINLSWKNNASNATAINIFESTDGVNFTSIATVGVYTTTFSRWFLTPSTTYYYRVSASNASGAASSATANATTSAPTPPRAASNLTVRAVDAYSIRLTWTDNSNAPNVEEDGFAMYVSTDGVNFDWMQTPGRDVTTYVDPDGLSPATRYWYQIVAFNVDGWAAPSNTASATTLAHYSRHLVPVDQPGGPVPHVTYHGGPLLPHVQVESIYAGQAWSSDAGLQQQMQQLDGFLNYFVASPYIDGLQQYGVAFGSFLGHDVVVQDPSGGKMIDDSQIRAVLDTEIAA